MTRRSSLGAALALLVALSACVRRPPEVAPLPAAVPAAMPAAADSAAGDATEYLRERGLIVPVVGVTPLRIPDTFHEGRSGARIHRATDILAPRGTPVLSADDGRILRISRNHLGGKTIYATDPNERVVYYYAHLDHYADGLVEGMKLAKGETIGYVGTTGNAPKDTPHLHFQVMRRDADKRYWEGTPIDVRPYLQDNGRSR